MSNKNQTKKDQAKESEGFLLIEYYDAVFAYLYKPLLNLPNNHSEFRKSMLRLILRIPGEIYLAAKLGQISKVYILDSSLAELRWHLRFAGKNQEDSKMRLLTRHQQKTAEDLLSKVGSIVNGWIDNKSK